MDIGIEKAPIIIQPLKEPVPQRERERTTIPRKEPAKAPERKPVKTPEKV